MASLLREARDLVWLCAKQLLTKCLPCAEWARLSLPPERRVRRLQVRFVVALALFLITAPFLINLPLFAQEQKASSQEFNLTLAGDSIVVTPQTVHQNDPRFMAVVNAVRQGDAAFTNLELTFPSAHAYPAAQSRATWIAADPAILKELQWVGFNLFSAANNHSVDFGIQGLLDTIQVLKRSGAAYAGIGDNLGEARAPAYLSTPHGRIALIACAATFQQDAPAGQARPDMRGRPGLNPLRHQTRYDVGAASLEALRKIRDDLMLGSGQGGSGSSQTVSFSFDGSSPVTFALSDKPGVITTPDPGDLAGLIHSIRDAREMADYVVTSVHSHEGIPGPDSLGVPAQFVVQFAHAAVDAGTDVFVSHGPHALRGIEIYKGKIIFYSLGNFIFENDLVVPQPTEFYQLLGLGPDALPSEAYDARSDHDRRSFPANPLLWQSVIAHVLFRDGRPAEVALTPITLGFGKKRQDRGYPQVADAATATQILERLQKLSEPLGTIIAIKNGVGVITIER